MTVNRNKNKRKLLLLGLLAPTLGHALTLGDVTVRSHLMETLRAEVPILAADLGELADLKLRLAGQQEFKRFGITRLPLHGQLRFRVREDTAGRVVEILSTQPVREPFVSIPLQALWPGGQLVREYTILLDPRPSPRPARAAAGPAPTPPAPVATPTVSDRQYGPVRPGETLWPIAQRLKPQGVATEQMLMALLRANPDAFPGGNVNNLQAGAVLRVPDLAAIRALTAAEARQAFRAQTAAWQGGGAAGGLNSRPAAPVPAAEPAGASQLRILGRAPEGSVVGDPAGESEQRRLLSLERAAAERIELDRLQVQVAQLQEEMAQMRRLLELKEQQIAALQRTQVPVPAAPALPSPTAAAAPAAAPAAAVATPPAPTAPAMVLIPDRVTPPPAAPSLWHNWWVWAAVSVFGLLLLALLVVWGRRRGPAADLVLAQHPAVAEAARPYAEQVARFGAVRAVDAPARSAAGAPSRAQPAAVDPALQVSEVLPSELEDQPLRELAQESLSSAPVSDAELASWARDLADEGNMRRRGEEDSSGRLDELDGLDDELDLALPLDQQRDDLEPLQGLDDLEVDTLPAVDLDDNTAVLKLELARAYLEIGDNDGARELLDQLVEESLSGPEQEEARRLLARLG